MAVARPRHAYATAAALGLVVNLVAFGVDHLVGASAEWDLPMYDSRKYMIGYRHFLHEPGIGRSSRVTRSTCRTRRASRSRTASRCGRCSTRSSPPSSRRGGASRRTKARSRRRRSMLRSLRCRRQSRSPTDSGWPSARGGSAVLRGRVAARLVLPGGPRPLERRPLRADLLPHGRGASTGRRDPRPRSSGAMR